MVENLITEGEFTYKEGGEGKPMILLHGLMGTASMFDDVFTYFCENGYKVLVPELPIYSLPMLKTNVKTLLSFYQEIYRS